MDTACCRPQATSKVQGLGRILFKNFVLPLYKGLGMTMLFCLCLSCTLIFPWLISLNNLSISPTPFWSWIQFCCVYVPCFKPTTWWWVSRLDIPNLAAVNRASVSVVNRCLLYFWRECRLVWPLWKTVWMFIRKLKLDLPYGPDIPHLGIYPEKELQSYLSFPLISALKTGLPWLHLSLWHGRPSSPICFFFYNRTCSNHLPHA